MVGVPTDEQTAVSSRRRTLARALGLLAMALMIAFWAWIFSGGPRKANPDRLRDREWVTRTAQRCQEMLEEIDRIPSAAETRTPKERAANVRSANTVIASMVDDIERSIPTDEADREVIERWIVDWRTLLGDRERYADAIADDPAARFRITENAHLRRGVDDTITTFADVNDMPACRTPGDVG